jgi:hypothetical protein
MTETYPSKRLVGLLNEDENYTLQPFIDFGTESLVCLWDDQGLKKATLIEIQVNFHDKNNSWEIIRGSNVFDTLREMNRQLAIGRGFSLRLATIKVFMADGREHLLTIEPPDTIVYDGDFDLIHRWLIKRGFVTHKSHVEKKYAEPPHQFLESS